MQSYLMLKNTNCIFQDTTSALIKSLRSYAGAILLVSHDRHLIQTVIEGAPLLPNRDEGDDDSDEEDNGDEDAQCRTYVTRRDP